MKNILLTTIFVAASLNTVSGEDSLLNYFIQWNNVPTDIYLGAMTESADITKTSLVNGTCFQYDVNGFDRCKFYSDCCAMTPTRSLEQLAAKTFSCHDGYYLVDKCPLVTENRELRDLCEVNSVEDSDISMKRWPVHGIVNHLSYKNIYCAICNGLDPYKGIDLQAQDWRGSEENRNTTMSTVEWWLASVECPTGPLQSYLNKQPNHQKLLDLISSSCEVLFLPPKTPDLCWESERTCPDGSSEELTKLCENGPANYINITTVNRVYRNQFCALCNGVSVDKLSQPELANHVDLLQIKWLDDKLHRHISDNGRLTTTLAVFKPTLSYNEFDYSIFNFTSFKRDRDVACSLFVESEFDFCEERTLTEEGVAGDNNTTPIWNLRSLACFSNHSKVCDQFLVAPTSECADSGCGQYSILDLQTLECVNVSNLVIGDEEVLETNGLPWHSQSICAYQSQCKLVELGLMQPHELNCFCDEQCIYYNDCCEDSPYQATKETKLPTNTFGCKKDGDIKLMNNNVIYWGVMEVNRCPSDSVEEQIKTRCEEISHYSFERKITQQTIPVTDYATGVRYANMYCAQCHNVQDIRFWTMDIGCAGVYNDECAHPHGGVDNSLYSTTNILRNDPSLDQLNNLYNDWDCSIKQYLPPEEIPTVRRCKYDAETYIATCPEHTKDWVIAQKCENAPTSFVYEGGTLSQSLNQQYYFSIFQQEYEYYGVGSFKMINYDQDKKFRNSYCASCHSVAWLGCNANKSAEITNGNPELYEQYSSGTGNYLFTYRIDLNKRSCRMDSDATLLYSDYTTGYDTCKTISNQLKQCNCQSMLNLETGQCLEIPYNNSNCLTNNYVTETFQLSSYASNCAQNIDYTPLESEDLAYQRCLACNSDPTNCSTVYEMTDNLRITIEHSSIHCAFDKILRCDTPSNSDMCAESWSLKGKSSGIHRIERGPKMSLLNSIAISYNPALNYSYSVKTDRILTSGFEQVFATFTDKALATCSEYSLINETSQQWLVCNGNILYDVTEDILYPDYLLRGEQLRVCTEYAKPEFELHVYNYVFSAFSIAAIIAYIVYYFVKARRSVTGNFVVSSLLTLAAGLICYCLINQVGSVVSCRIIASLSQYFLLGVHTWTNAIGIWMIRGITSIRRATELGWKSYIRYAAYAWVTPLSFVGLAYFLQANKGDIFYPVFADDICFIADGWSRLLVFTGPIYFFILLNSILCIVAMVKIFEAGSRVTANDKTRTQRKVITVIKLQVVFGFHWILLLFTLIEGPHQSVIWSILNVLLTLQGVFVVLMQLLSMKNITKLKNHLQSVSQSNSTAETSQSKHKCNDTNKTELVKLKSSSLSSEN